MIHSLRRLDNTKNLLPANVMTLYSSWIHGILVVKIHVRLSTLRRLDRLARSKDLVKESILLLTAIRIAPFNFKLFLCASRGSPLLFLVITNICVVICFIPRIFVLRAYNSKHQIPTTNSASRVLLLVFSIIKELLLMMNEACVDP